MALQSNSFAATSGVTSGSCVFNNPQVVGNTNVVFISASNFTIIAPTVVNDTAGNTYTLQLPAHTGEQGGYANTWIYVAINIRGGTNTVNVTLSGNAGYQYLAICVVEEAASGGVRAYNINQQSFSSAYPSVSLTGTVTNDVTVLFTQCESNNTDWVSGPATIGSNSAANLQNFFANNSTQFIIYAGDGLSSGGTITCQSNANNWPQEFTAAAVCLIPSSTYQPGPPGGPRVLGAAGAGW
jgi:hypothetical protein